MLDGSHYFECACGSSEHTLRFTLDKEDKEIYTDVYLNQYRAWYMRLLVGIKYIFGYKCKYGHWDNWILYEPDIIRLRNMCDELISIRKSGSSN